MVKLVKELVVKVVKRDALMLARAGVVVAQPLVQVIALILVQQLVAPPLVVQDVLDVVDAEVHALVDVLAIAMANVRDAPRDV